MILFRSGERRKMWEVGSPGENETQTLQLDDVWLHWKATGMMEDPPPNALKKALPKKPYFWKQQQFQMSIDMYCEKRSKEGRVWFSSSEDCLPNKSEQHASVGVWKKLAVNEKKKTFEMVIHSRNGYRTWSTVRLVEVRYYTVYR